MKLFGRSKGFQNLEKFLECLEGYYIISCLERFLVEETSSQISQGNWLKKLNFLKSDEIDLYDTDKKMPWVLNVLYLKVFND